MTNNGPNYKLSPLAAAYLDYERSQTMVRLSEQSCSGDEVLRLLGEHGLPASDAVRDFEQNLGGWCSSNPHALSGFGVCYCLRSGPNSSPVAEQLRRSAWVFEGNRDEADEDGEVSPLWGTGYPRAFFEDRALTIVGMNGPDALFFLGPDGELYLWIMSLDRLSVLAGSARTMLERNALEHFKQQLWFEVHICADVSQLVQEVLDMPVYEPACDHLFRWWANDTSQVRLIPDFAPCITGTHVACEDEEDFVKAMVGIKDGLGVERLRVWKGANAINDDRGIGGLSRAGIGCEILSGPGPGHGSDAYDVSLCEPKNWT